jgi:hypothetical protein
VSRKSRSHPPAGERVARLNALARELNLRPFILPGADGVKVAEGRWEIVVRKPGGSYTARERAWLLAGNLYLLKQRPEVVKEYFYTVVTPESVKIYCEDLSIHDLYITDLPGSGFENLDALAAWHIDKFADFIILNKE